MAAGQGQQKYGLILMPSKAKKAPSKVSSVFGNESSDEDESSIQKVNESLRTSGKNWVAKQTQDAINKAVAEDPTVFEYDAIYDQMESKKKQAGSKNTLQPADRKPKYIQKLKEAAELRKKEQEIIFERKMKKEVDVEADKFADKDAFVTPSYRKLLEERWAEEKRLKKKEEMEGSGQKKDLTVFRRNMLNSRVAAREGTLQQQQQQQQQQQRLAPGGGAGVAEDSGGDAERSGRRQAPTRDQPEARQSADRHGSRPSSDRRSPDSRDSRRSPDSRDSRQSPDRQSRRSPDNRDSRRSPDNRDSGQSPDRHESRLNPSVDSSSPIETAQERRGSEGHSSEEEQHSNALQSPTVKVEADSSQPSAEIVRKRKADKRNDASAVVAARERYLARKKAKPT